MFQGETIKVFTLNNHSLYLCSENKQLGKSVIITTNLNKSKVTQYKEELLYIVPEMSLENLLKQYKLFNEFIDLYIPQRDIELIRRKDGIHTALLCSYFLKHLNLVEALLVFFFINKTLQTLDIGLPEQKYMESLKEYEQSIKKKFKIKIEEVLPNKTKFQQVESWISKDAEPEVKSELAQSIVMSQAVFEERLIEQPTYKQFVILAFRQFYYLKIKSNLSTFPDQQFSVFNFIMNSQWIENICLVKFDIEIGQIVEWTQPVKSLNEVDEKNISMLAFPDSNSFAQNEGMQHLISGQLKYVFRMKRSSGKIKFSLGFTLFMQKKDEDNPRGYTQKSVVILTNLPLVSFYYNLLDNIYANIKQGCMKAQLQYAFEQISNWEKPSPNRLFNLSLFNSKIAVEVPHYLKMQKADSEQNVELQEIMYDLTLSNMIQFDDLRDVGQFQETNLYTALPHAMLVHLPKLWELVLTNQPFMVMADSPSQCSEVVLGIISLMSPMRFTGDYRPYFTIYDKEFQQIASELENSFARNIIIGVTNPFFLKAYNKFPVIVRCDQKTLQIQQNKEFCLNDDKETLRMLIPIKNEETKAINNSLIKKVYRNMSLEFIGMFEMYFASQQNQVKKFDEKEFLEFLKTCKVSFQGLFENKPKFLKLYQNFIRSSNFVSYLNERKSVYIAKSIL